MKILFSVFCILSSLLCSANAAELVLDTAVKSGGITTKITVGRIQADPAADGSITLQIIPREVVTAEDGTVISDKFLSDWVPLPLPPAILDRLNTAISTRYAAAKAEKAAAIAAATAEAAPAK